MANDQESRKIPWHALSEEEVLQKVDSDQNGLTAEQAREHLDKYGRNILEEEKGISPVQLVIKQLRSPLIYLLMGAAVISLLTQHYIDASVIAGVIVINTALGVVQEWRAERALEALRQMAAPRAIVLRNGEEQEIAASKVAAGDILLLRTGDRAAADARLLRCDSMRSGVHILGEVPYQTFQSLKKLLRLLERRSV